jgi:Uma2 family endonuclease
MVKSDSRLNLPSSAELPCSDDTPVDNEDQNLLPNYLLFLLYRLWAERQDWFFAVDMGIYHTTGINPRVPVVPDGFLSLGVERKKAGKSRKSYVVWEENDTVPILALEVVSQTPGGEYGTKLEIYRALGILYYVIYNPEFWRRDGHLPFEVYKLIDDTYQLQRGEPYWMPEVGLGIGRHGLQFGAIAQEGLTWYDPQGNPYLSAEELIRVEQHQRQLAEHQRERLAAKLRELGINPDEV